jgi:hypothetical protein
MQQEHNNNKEQKDTGYSKNAAPGISLPKGGGAMRGIDEKFTVNAVNGTAGMSIPLPTGPSRGFAPELTIGYNSGGGNSEFGLGWGLSLPFIQRKTDKQLPKYNDAQDSDTFLFSGAEDLVIQYIGTTPQKDIPYPSTSNAQYLITTYIPRTEGLYARIQKVKRVIDGDVYWKVTTNDNTTTFFGYYTTSRIADPAMPSRIYKWLPDAVYNDKGQLFIYTYKAENIDNVPHSAHEAHRLKTIAPLCFTNVYIKSAHYGNHIPYNPTAPFELNNNILTQYFYGATLFDYGEYIPEPMPLDISTNESATELKDYLLPENTTWACRKDPFSFYQPGFEVRTYRLCKRILALSCFEEHHPDFDIKLQGNIKRTIVTSSVELEYKFDNTPNTELLETDYIIAIYQKAYKLINDGTNDIFKSKSLPPIQLTYQEPEWYTEIQNASESFKHVNAVGMNNPYQWLDFYGEGINGFLREDNGAWYYNSNEGEGNFSPAQKIANKPSFSGLGSQVLQWQDLDADGQRQVVATIGESKGYWQMNAEDEWDNFTTLKNNANIEAYGANLRMLDLTGDGKQIC